MEHLQIGDHQVTFDPEQHQYTVDGRSVPSISRIVETLRPRRQARIDPEILQMAATRGNTLKQNILDYEQRGRKVSDKELQSYHSLKRLHQFSALKTDTVVLLFKDGIVVGAGRFDFLVASPHIDGKGLASIKRSLHLDTQRLQLQLNLYRLGYEQTYRQRIDYLKCMHIRGRNGAYVDIPIDRPLAERALETYLEKHPPDYTAYTG